MTAAMARELAEFPHILVSRASSWQDAADRLRGAIGDRLLALVGRGSSGNAVTYLQYQYGLRTGRQALDFRPWLAGQEVPRADWSRWAALCLSASGESTDIVGAARWLHERGARILGISNAADTRCSLGAVADELCLLGAGTEQAVPATKSLLAQMCVAAAVTGEQLGADLDAHASLLRELLAWPDVSEHAALLARARSVCFLGRGPMQGTAQDACLKAQEAAGLLACAYSTAEFFHGPLGYTDPSDAVVLFEENAGDALADRLRAALRARGVRLLHYQLRQRGAHPARWFEPVALLALAQRMAHEMAHHRGRQPDRPAGLAKVTRT
jgi:glucosamine--fructose-6-phosphate aminotransferase (isomerizing)